MVSILNCFAHTKCDQANLNAFKIKEKSCFSLFCGRSLLLSLLIFITTTIQSNAKHQNEEKKYKYTYKDIPADCRRRFFLGVFACGLACFNSL